MENTQQIAQFAFKTQLNLSKLSLYNVAPSEGTL